MSDSNTRLSNEPESEKRWTLDLALLRSYKFYNIDKRSWSNNF